jgi:hypothetical protein|tara:strand:- start:1362 stop:1883 length:522 start_codon:yes stop_codon:yes gene_type:complete
MKHNKYNKKDPVKVKDDLIGHNQPPGHQVPDYDLKSGDKYFDDMPVGTTMKKRIKDTGQFTGKELKDGHVFPTLTGPQKEKIARLLLDGKEYLRYKDINVAVRMTIPLVDIKMIKSTSVHLRALSKVLNDIAKDTEKSKFERVLNAQQAIVSTNGSIKWKHGLFEMLGVHSLR